MVIALDKHKKPVGFITEKRARRMMEQRKACIYRHFPMTVILMDKDVREMEKLPSFRIKIDPGSKYTGISIVGNEDDCVYLYLQIAHRADQVVSRLRKRSAMRRNRRTRETWYRRAKWGNQPKAGHQSYSTSRVKGWLPPSQRSICGNLETWVKRLYKLIHITEVSFEAVRFDTHLMDNPEIEGKEYQQGTLFGLELKEYLLDRYQHTCQYCGGKSGDKVLEWEHMMPKSRGGSDSVKNATLACSKRNQEKSNRTPEEWLSSLQTKKNPTKLDEARMEYIPKAVLHEQVKGSNRYCAWVTSLRRQTEKILFSVFGEGHVECSSGGKTKYNREKLGLPKDHHYDALCVGTIPEDGYRDRTGGHVLYVIATGRGTRFRGKANACGVITQKLVPRPKKVSGFMNGDIVSADVPKGKYQGHHVGRVMVRASGRFDIRTGDGLKQGISSKYCRLLQCADGYAYQRTPLQKNRSNSSRQLNCRGSLLHLS